MGTSTWSERKVRHSTLGRMKGRRSGPLENGGWDFVEYDWCVPLVTREIKRAREGPDRVLRAIQRTVSQCVVGTKMKDVYHVS